MKICYFGDYDPDYSRNKIIIKGLRLNGIEVFECRTDVRGRSLKKLIELYKRHKLLKNDYDVMIVGYSDSRIIVPLARLISTKKVFWDAFYSLYDSWVFDRALVAKNSLKAKYYWLLDWLNCKLAFKILLDTNEHIKYFVETFGIGNEKFIKVLVGSLANEEKGLKKKLAVKNDKFKVFFYGNFIPLQGIEYIVRAAKILENEQNIQFEILGGGQTYESVKKLAVDLGLENIEFIDKTSYRELVEHIQSSDVCLGIFGDTGKAKRVIPNKIYDAIALGKPVISGDTPAVRELFEDGKNILLCRVADEKSLADKIIELRINDEMRKGLAREGFKLFEERAMPKMVVSELLEKLKGK